MPQTRSHLGAGEPHRMSPRQNPGSGALAGAIGGIAGVFAMTALQILFDHLHGSPTPRPVHELSKRGGRHDIARLKARARKWHLPQRDATIRTAERVSYLFRARGIQPQWRHAAGVAVHYAFGAFIGAAYGFAFEVNPRVESTFPARSGRICSRRAPCPLVCCKCVSNAC